jgi:transcriptional regulator with GAF, ATPase, and Fis domain
MKDAKKDGRERASSPAPNKRGNGGKRGQSKSKQAEIERLKRKLGDETFATELRHTLALASAAGTIASPVSHSRLLEMIVETAAHVISAQAASLFLIDKDTEELIFEVALGQKAEEVKKFRVPLGHGIAGYVALSGQPIAVSDAQHDPRHAADISESIGYAPKNLLCVPLFYDDQIIGALELLDKQGAPTFDTHDMEVLGYFANQAAVAIEQSRIHRNLVALMMSAVEPLPEVSKGAKQEMKEQARVFTANAEDDPDFRRALDLARLVQRITSRGENELKVCERILNGLVEYLDSRVEPGAGW